MIQETAYQEALEWLYVQAPNYQKEGKKAYKPGLDNITKLCDFFDNPQRKLKTIHIGGTNGKGSTCNMLASILQQEGYSVGVYNSPHLVDFTERIKVNGKNADKLFVYDFIQKLKRLPKDILPSFFEFTTIMAFEYFYQKKVDFAIIEVGLGGRLDSTNIVSPILSAITNVALDHQDILGESIEEIAREKAGIIKPNTPVISGDENPIVKEIIKNKANEKGADFVDATLLNVDFETDLKGKYQKKNLRVVQGIVEKLRELGLEISDENLKQGLMNVQKNTNFMGRWFEFSQNPLTICDTGHNQAGLEEVFSQLNELPHYKRMVLGFVQEKKIDEVLKILPKNASYYFAKPNIFRGRHPKDYENLLKEAGISYKIFDKVNDAYLASKSDCQLDEVIFIGGSNFVVGDFLEKNLEN
ncbi:MAG: folylpolyglutamate synthase/dihydrofolate synthase family protein [Flavobacteriaceae bacterium]|nr:folylpolyglutamate synthase/dihydrofolate synthase family protein [Flavobacteriaceae bacterium]